MSHRTNKTIERRTGMILCSLILLAGLHSGCTSKWREPSRKPAEPKPAQPTKITAPEPEKKNQDAREVAPEDVEAFRNAVNLITLLEYAQAESEIRVLLVRFESVDDPKYCSEALFWLGYCCEKQGALEQARDYYKRVSEHYPDTRPGKQAIQRLKLLPTE